MDRKLAVAFALLLILAGSPLAAACKSYDQMCAGAGQGDCCTGLLCQDFRNISSGGTFKKCTQDTSAGVCTIVPGTYSPPLLSGSIANNTSGVANATLALASGSGIIGSGSGVYKAGWFSDWNTAGLLGVAITIAIVAMAAMVGRGFSLPEVKAFADAEMMQAVVSVLLVASLIGLVGFFDLVARQAIEAGDLPVACGSEPCYITAAKTYLQTLYDTADQSARTQLSESVSNQKAATFGISTQLNFWWLLFAGGTYRPNAGLSIPAERAGAIFEITTKMMASISAQKYFIEVVSFGIAPIFLLLGIVLRGMFFTRKLGGLLLAMAIALFIIYPLTYAFAWYTLNVTVYGERTLGVSDPSCPAECTARYPVAFYVKSSGELEKFETTQSMIRAGINNSNWESGDVGNDGTVEFPGLVACRNLTEAKITAAQNSCNGCPDYCREVPFPTNLPGCDITACSECNAGCKIIRQRADCSDPGSDNYCADAGNACPMSCRTKLPTENKCYYADGNPGNDAPANIVPAQLNTTCGGCGTCPNWCRFVVKNASGYELVYKDEAACSSCNSAFDNSLSAAPNPSVPSCPLQCMYTTEVGKTISCDTLCNGCPKYCRVNDTGGTWFDTYDVDPPGLEAECSSAACQSCPSECKVAIETPAAGCAAFPTTTPPTSCQNCPEYCRYTDFSFISPSSSISGGAILNSMCKQGLGGRLDCSAPACDASACKVQPGAPTCREYDASDGSAAYCRHCPTEVRLDLVYQSGGATLYSGPPLLSDPASCQDANCGTACKPVRELANQSINPICGTEAQTGCAYGCRLTGADGYLDSSCLAPANTGCTATWNMHVNDESSYSESLTFSCSQPALLPSPPFACTKSVSVSCSVDPGEGGEKEKSVEGTARKKIFFASIEEYEQAVWKLDVSPGDCTATATYQCEADGLGYSCARDFSFTHTDAGPWSHTVTTPSFDCEVPAGYCSMLPSACKINAALPSNQGYTCSEFLGNGPGNPVDAIPINDRANPYNDRSSCKQCPENCRINGYEGDCGIANNTNNQFVDCSNANCGMECRVEVPVDPAPGAVCQPFAQFGQPCDSCPALCRRSLDTLAGVADCPSEKCGPYDPVRGVGCTESCQVEDPPVRICENCFNCELDCTYYPAVRTDCSTVCSDEALAGPVNIGPEDFIKSLPGAKGQVDVKNVGTLMVPALVMPLFCLVIVIAFIRVFSPVLGGDMEIPGLGRII